jgi:hypothetical protein
MLARQFIHTFTRTGSQIRDYMLVSEVCFHRKHLSRRVAENRYSRGMDSSCKQMLNA